MLSKLFLEDIPSFNFYKYSSSCFDHLLIIYVTFSHIEIGLSFNNERKTFLVYINYVYDWTILPLLRNVKQFDLANSNSVSTFLPTQ